MLSSTLEETFDEYVSGDASWVTVGHILIEIFRRVNFFLKKYRKIQNGTREI